MASFEIEPDEIDEKEPRKVTANASVASKVSFATHQNAVPVLRELRVENGTDRTYENLRLTISVDPPVFAEKSWTLDRLGPQAVIAPHDRDLNLNATYLDELREAVRATVRLRCTAADGELLAEDSYPIELLARSEWGGAGAQPELLASFVLSNDPAVTAILRAASEVLRRAGKQDAIDGYQSRSRTRVHELVSAIWSAVAGLRLTYAEPPASFEANGQKIRTPSEVHDGRLATCLDTAVLFAAACETAGLNAGLVLTRGHAFVGVWLQPQEFSSLLVEDAAALRKRIALKELIVFETTLVTGATPASFSQAQRAAERQLAEEREHEFVMALDLRRARMQRLRPLALLGELTRRQVASDEPQISDSLEESPQLPDFDEREPEAAPTTPEGRLVRWQRKLLDLTAKNRLLDLKPGAAIRLLCPDPAALEDSLAEGRSFRIRPLPELSGRAGRDTELHAQRTGEELVETSAAEALKNFELLSPLPAEKLEAQLIELYRKTKLDLAEGGANTLFLALGFLNWKKSETDTRSYRAPLILVPVKLERQNVRAGVRLSLHEDEPRFNLTLLQLLKQDFELEIPQLAKSLPIDDRGIDVSLVWNLVRQAVKESPGFEVVPDVALGAFSFAKYLMWKDLVDRTQSLLANPVVGHLINTPKDTYAGARDLPDVDRLDHETAPAEIFAPLPADSSQLAAIVASARGHDFVLDGPPGTGKSQTIANMIAHNLALGRKVLFVAEKKTALDVVYRRLVQHNLGIFCLELHSNKAVKKEVLQQLDVAWRQSGAAAAHEWEQAAQQLKMRRDDLNALVHALHRPHSNGWTLYAAIGRVVRDGELHDLRLAWPTTLSHDADAMRTLRETVRALDLHQPAPEMRATEVFAHIGKSDWSNGWQGELLVKAKALSVASRELAKARDTYLRMSGFDLPPTQTGLGQLADLSRALLLASGRNLAFAFSPDAHAILAAGGEASRHLDAYEAHRAALSVRLSNEQIRTLPVATLEQEWSRASSAIWPFSYFKKKKVRLAIDSSGTADPTRDLPGIKAAQAELAKLGEVGTHLSVIAGWSGVETDRPRLRETLDRAEKLRSAIARAGDSVEQLASIRARVREICVDANELLEKDGPLDRAGEALRAAVVAFDEARTAFEVVAASPDPIEGEDMLAATQAIAEAVQAHATKLNSWCTWRKVREAALENGLQDLVAVMEAGGVDPSLTAAELFETAYARWWASIMIDAEPAVRTFNVVRHADLIDQFRRLDEQVAKLSQAYIHAKVAGEIPSKDSQALPTGYNVLRHQLSLQTRHKPVRQLLSEMGSAVTQLAPCLLMSPLSVAQYLPAAADLFDLVIFDEASQITPWDAVGAIARGRQVVVAGDPKQMPPSRYMERGAAAQDDDSDIEEDHESILDECLSAGLRQHRLTWHYRSRHESLIAFSNHRYYLGDLITFPAPVTRPSMVTWRKVSGAWARGAARTNQVEAKAIVDEALARLLSPDFVDEQGRRLSLGIVTMNAEQQKLIEDLLDTARRGRPELEPYFGEDVDEPVIVKNLETVQGDERDVILLGIGYGPIEPDAPVMSMNFGPLNKKGGERRLNVAVSRARREMMIVTSFPPNLIDLNRTNAVAVRDLKHFVEYADRGPRALSEAVSGSVGGFDSPFEQAVARALRNRGWTVVPQIGVSRYRIDLGVVHPDRPGDYLVGVECDGAMYHRAATARDRDKVREAVLRSLGWELVRVWSTDWWVDQQAALDRLHGSLTEHLKRSRKEKGEVAA